MRKMLLVSLSVIYIISLLSFASSNAFLKIIGIPDRLQIDPGQEITIKVFIAGRGEVKHEYISVYSAENAPIYSITFSKHPPSFINKGENPTEFIVAMDLESFNDAINQTVNESDPRPTRLEAASPPISIVIGSKKNIVPGNHKALLVLTWQDEEGWHQQDYEVNYRVTSPYERSQGWLWFWGILITVTIALFRDEIKSKLLKMIIQIKKRAVSRHAQDILVMRLVLL